MTKSSLSKQSFSWVQSMPAVFTGWMFFLFCYVSRVEPSVIASELMKEFKLTASAFGWVGSFFYIAYVSIQIPTGILLDRWGSRIIIALGAAISSLAVFVFGSAHSLLQLEIGRFLLGLATASGFIGCTKIISEHVPSSKYSLFVGISMFMGCLGGICGSVPTAWLVSHLGWRATTFTISAFGALLSILAFFCMSPQAKKVADRPTKLFHGISILAKKPSYWALGVLCAISYLPMTAVAELWGTPFIEKKFNIPTEEAAFFASAIFIGYGIGSIITPWLTYVWNSCKKVLFVFSLLSVLSFLPVILWEGLSLSLSMLFLFLFGVFSGTVPLFFTMAFRMVPPQYGGSSSGLTNMINMSGAVIFQPLLGSLLDFFRNGLTAAQGQPLYTFDMYKYSFLVVMACMALSILLLLVIEDVRPQEDHSK
jgi:MFS family permease